MRCARASYSHPRVGAKGRKFGGTTPDTKMADLSEFVSSKGTQKEREQRSKERQRILDKVGSRAYHAPTASSCNGQSQSNNRCRKRIIPKLAKPDEKPPER